MCSTKYHHEKKIEEASDEAQLERIKSFSRCSFVPFTKMWRSSSTNYEPPTQTLEDWRDLLDEILLTTQFAPS